MKEWLTKTLAKIDWQKIEGVVLEIEQTFIKNSGAEKRAAAIELLNKVIDIPLLPESVEAILIGWVVDQVVAQYNRFWGHQWGVRGDVPVGTSAEAH